MTLIPCPLRRALAVLLLAAGGLCAQAPKPQEIVWVRDVDSAFKTATAEKKPVLFVIMKDQEIGCSRMLEQVYSDAGIRTRLASFVLLPCSTYDHTGGASDKCSQFPGVSCAEHQAIEREMRRRFQDENVVVAPQHIATDPAGRVLSRRLYEMKTAGFAEFLDRAITSFVEGVNGAASKPAAPEAASRPAGGAEPASGPKKLPPELELRVVAILRADDAGKERLTKELLAEPSAERRDAFLDVVARLKSSKDKEIVIRAIGYPEFAGVAPAVITLLAEKDTLARNCAVVTLEEMANPAASEALVALHKKEKEPEIRKDVVRALGPAGGGKPEARAVLLKELSNSQDNVRAGAAMSLGHFLAGDADVEKALRVRWAKDGSNLKVKTAILWGIAMSNDPGQAKLVDDLVKDDNNGQIKQVAEGVKTRLAGGDPFTGGRGGGGRFGGGRGGILRLLAPLYDDDKIVRNRIKEFRNFGGR